MSVLSILFMSGRYDAYSISKAGDWHGGLARGNGDHQQIPHYQNGGGGLMMVIWSMEGAECGRDGDGGLSSSCQWWRCWRGERVQNRIPPCQKWGIHGAGGNWWTGVSSTGPHKSIPPKVGAVQMPPHSFVRVPQRCACSMEGYASQAMPSDSKSTSPTLVANGYKERIWRPTRVKWLELDWPTK